MYISFGTFFGQGIVPASQHGVKQCNQNMESDIYGNTALTLAPDLQKPSNPTNLLLYSQLSKKESLVQWCKISINQQYDIEQEYELEENFH